MTIAVYHRGGAGALAFVAGALLAGLKVVAYRMTPSQKGVTVNPRAVACVIEALHGQGRSIRESYRAKNIPVWIIELPRLRAGRVGSVGPHGSSTHGFYLDTLHYLSPIAGNTAVVAGVIEWREPEYMLVAGQKPNDTAHGMSHDDSSKWARETIEKCREYNLPVCFRPHPQAVQWKQPEDNFGADSLSRPSQQTIRDALSKAAALVTYNSTTGVDAIDAGVPVFYTAPEAEVAYHEYAARLGDETRALTNEERETCLLRFAATQWTIEQMKTGTTARCLFMGHPFPTPEIITLSEAEERADAVAKTMHAEKIERRAPKGGTPALPARHKKLWQKGRA